MHKYKKHWIKFTAAAALCILAAAVSHPLSANENMSADPTTSSTAKSVPQPAAIPQPAMPVYTVVSCNDGDTCKLRSPDNTQIKVRLAGIDAPEMGKKSKKKKKEGQSGGKEAKDFLNSLVVGKTVTLKSYGTDAYGRNLAEIIINNQSANLKMVAEGWAEVYRGKGPRGFDVTTYQAAQADAMRNKKGVWSLSDYESPKEFRKKNRN
jgi:endonuclease YncB( thermonuclease family)